MCPSRRNRVLTLCRRLRHQSYTGPVVVKEFDSGFLENARNLAQRIGARSHRPVKAFHPANGSQCYFGFLGKVVLRPSEERPRGPNMPAC